MRIGSIRSLDLSDFHPDDKYLSVNHRSDTDTPLKTASPALKNWCRVVDRVEDLARI